MRTPQEIVKLVHARRGERAPMIEQARKISEHYNGAIAVPLPEIDSKESPGVANLVSQGIDQHSMRIASVLPQVFCPPAKPGVKLSEERARVRHLVVNGWWENNAYDLLARKRARHLVGYSGSPVLLRPDTDKRIVRWDVKSPLDTYPSVPLDDQDMLPSDVIFSYTRTFKWLKDRYPGVVAQIAANALPGDKENSSIADDARIELLQYIDADSNILIATGSASRAKLITEVDYGIDDRSIRWLNNQDKTAQWMVPLRFTDNPIGRCPVVYPSRISLDNPRGMFDDVIDIFLMQAKLMALEINAVTRAVYPDTWYIRQPGGQGVVVEADGLRGVLGEVDGGQFHELAMNPGFQTGQVIDRLERAQRLNAAMPAEYGAESPTNVRTDVRGRSVFSAGVDFYIEEAQKLIGKSMQYELQIAADIETRYFDTKKSFYVQWGKAPGPLDYTPSDIFGESKVMLIDYAYTGVDINALSVALGQGVSTGIVSTTTARQYHPLVKNAKREEALIVMEGLNRALLAGIEQQATTGQIPPGDIARMSELMGPDRGLDFASVVKQVQAEAQARQASQQSAGGPTDQAGNPVGAVPPGSPEAQQGLGTGPAGAAAASIPAPTQDLNNLKAQLQGLTAGSRLTGPNFNA